MPLPPRPTAAAAPAFAALVRALRSSPALASVRWSVRDGSPRDDDTPIVAGVPWVRLTPTALPVVPHTRVAEARPIRVLVETAEDRTKGFAGSDALWARLDAALFHRDRDDCRRLRAEVRAAGGNDLVLEQPALPGSGPDYGEALTTGKGSFRIDIYVRTR